jgi:hypothetical protein
VKRFIVALLTPNFLTLAEVLAFHDRQVQRFGGYDLVLSVAQGDISNEELTAKLSGAIAFRQS